MYHVNKFVWTPFTGEILPLRVEDGNEHDHFSFIGGVIVGPFPRKETTLFPCKVWWCYDLCVTSIGSEIMLGIF